MLNKEDELDLLSDDESTKNLFANVKDSTIDNDQTLEESAKSPEPLSVTQKIEITNSLKEKESSKDEKEEVSA